MMKMLRHLKGGLLSAAFALGGLVATAQTPEGVVRKYPEHQTGYRCAFDSAQQAAFARQPGAATAYRAFLQNVVRMPAATQARLLAAPDVTVPIVVHIIHTGGSNNISDAQVNDALRVINEDYSKTNRDTADVIPAFQSLYANIGFRFRLAKKDPNGNCTTGITRTYSTDTNIGDDRVKSLIVWPQDKYLNIWVCTSANGAGGYAYLPCSGGTADGIVIRNAQFGSIGTSGGSNLAVRSLTHEIGHYFGLPHTWGGSNTPGLASNCSIDDGIADTPNTIGCQLSCSAAYGGGTVLYNFNACGPLANVQNYMDYSGCTRMFTLGQRAVMRASLQLGCRQVLTSAANLVATGTNDGYVAPNCAPVVAFQASATTICDGSTVTFTDYSYNASLTAATYAWQFPGGVPSTSTLRNPTVTYPTGGLFDATLTVTAGGATGTATRTGLVQVIGGNSGLVGAVAESFEAPGFPANFTAPDLRNWTSSSNAATTAARWIRRTSTPGGLAVSDGTACVLVPSSVLTAGTQTMLTSPNINLSGLTAADQPAVTFDRAYALRTGQANESLAVQFSNDCGLTWATQRSFFSLALNTRDTLRTYGYTPLAASEWKGLRVDIPASYLTNHFQVRLTMLSNGGNYIYLDKLAVGASPLLATRSGAGSTAARVYPNPLTAESVVEFSLAAPGPVELRLTDLLGRPVGAVTRAAGRAGVQTLHLVPAGTARPASGIYLVELQTANARSTNKVVIP
ncbi:M43 family zinc metalloprotease [Hymenobacter negativus]|uniref:T9SS type A sorting domain-containing protein n=1 Tax=Hymenobacter negativus TaxID=2795026 RepID=A0ABS0Q351_9BACT|nr:M43 family zinc metalloprotease [Hymenobacter negativus]MBH8557054.1 T9SS type A sorting domain-containing protein [Hymenobacter negativus]